MFHSYIRAPANEVAITPLHGITYYDKTEPTDELRAQPKTETRTAVDVKKFTDSVYENAPGKYLINSLLGKVEVKTKNFPNVVVWNPQAEAGAKIGDMEDRGWFVSSTFMIYDRLLILFFILGRNMSALNLDMCEDSYRFLLVRVGSVNK